MVDLRLIPVALRDAIEHQQTVQQILAGVAVVVAVVVAVEMGVAAVAVLLLFGISHNKKALLSNTSHYPNTMLNYICNVTAMCLTVFFIFYSYSKRTTRIGTILHISARYFPVVNVTVPPVVDNYTRSKTPGTLSRPLHCAGEFAYMTVPVHIHTLAGTHSIRDKHDRMLCVSTWWPETRW